MSKLLINEPPLQVLPTLARLVGLYEAIVLQQVQYWTDHNRKKRQNYRDGHYWTYNTYEEWREQFPFWGVSTIRRVVKGLEERGLLVSGNYNAHWSDRTKWYRIDYEELGRLLTQNAHIWEVSDNTSARIDGSDTQDFADESFRQLQEMDLVKKVGKTSVFKGY